jgi:tetratricopeptide (TPR) repeat protein
MKRLLVGVFVALFVMGIAASVRGEGIFKEEPKKDEPAAAAPAAGEKAAAPAETKSELPARTVTAIEASVARAEKLLQFVQTEMAKDEAKRNVTKAQEARMQAANAYLQAAQQAKAAIASLKEDQRAGASEQYDKPNRQKAIDIYMELAQAAMERKDYNRAKALYAQVVKLDPENAAAKEALKKADQDAKAAAKEGKSGSKGGGNETTKDPYNPGKTDHSQTGRTQSGDWRNSGRTGW